jgi:hypothetical protein
MNIDYLKYIKYKNKYLELKKINQNGGKLNFLNLPKKSKLIFGSTGNNSIIALTPREDAYKIFPLIIYPFNTKLMINQMNNNTKYEILIIKKLTKNIVDKNLTHHIIKYINNFKSYKYLDILFKNCPSYNDYLLSKKKSSDKCNLIYSNNPIKLGNSTHILQIEQATGSLKDEIIKISKEKWIIINLFLDRLFFQVFYTLESIKRVYPNFSHNDLFIRNILTKENKYKYKNDDYFRYYYKGNVFDLPAQGLFIAFNDFGISDLTPTLTNKYRNYMKIIINPQRDYFSILFDVYNGSNLGSNSLYNLIKNKYNLNKIDKYFNQFMNIKVIKKIIDNKKKTYLDWNWNNMYDPKFNTLIGLKDKSYFINYFLNKYPTNNSHNIVNTFGK